MTAIPESISQSPSGGGALRRPCALAIALTLLLTSTACMIPISPPTPAPMATVQPRPVPSGRASAGDIVIGVSAAFNGPSSGLGTEIYRGSIAYLEQVNARGGVNGRQVVLQAYDDGYDPVPAIDNTIRLVEEDGIFALMDYVGTPTVTRVLPLLKRYSSQDVLLLFPFTGAQPHREPPYDEFVFNLRASYREETEGLVDRFVALGRNKIAVFYQADAYGRSGWDGVRRALAKRGLQLAAEATYRRGTAYAESMSAQVQILREANPDAIISIGAYAACAAFVRDARDAGWDVPIANVSFVGSGSLLDLLIETGRARAKDYTANLINSEVVPSYEDTSLPAVREYRQAMDRYNPMPPGGLVAAGQKPLRYSAVSLEGYLNAKVLVAALEKMGSAIDRTRLKATMESIQHLDVGIGAPVSFGPAKHQGLNAVYYTAVSDGRFGSIDNWKRWAK